MTDPRARREWIRAHHPDAGGDPDVFRDGLAAFARPDSPPARPRIAVVRREPLLRRLLHRLPPFRRTAKRRLT